jgi:hypothetical protein
MIAAINIAAFALIYAVARLLTWVKSAPWSSRAPASRETATVLATTRVREVC